LYGAEILAENIEDNAANYTRFLLVAKPGEIAPRPGPRKTTIVFRTPNTPGALFRALAVFALRDINLTKLESRPIRGRPWEYLFYVEVEARRDDMACSRALMHLAEFAKWTRVLGTYKGWQRKQPES
jgi:prephenate dehydratase